MTAGGRAVFLDRDGTLNRERGFVTKPEELEILPGVVPALQALRAAGYRLVVVTNQSGIAHGLYGEHDLARVHEALHAGLAGLPDAYLHCPHHPDVDGECGCRKPAPGLLLQARELLGIRFEGSVLVGDSARDLLAGRVLSLRTFLVRSGKPWREELAHLAAAGVAPDEVCDDLAAAVDLVLGRTGPG